MASTRTMLTATYNMKALKALNVIDEGMKNKLVAIFGCEGEDDLPEHIQNLDLQEIASNRPAVGTVAANLAKFLKDSSTVPPKFHAALDELSAAAAIELCAIPV
mmetsp:Transcript_2488/g.8743  ORF Transcript_2488/g.8743 Transcript_2488/m.8743 type:complete len:104 (-) Transcript_2488:221-532(-)